MKAVCFYFQVHQPFRLRKYRFFDIGKDHYYYDDYTNESTMRKLVLKSYLPTNNILLRLIKKHGDHFRVAFSISGLALDQMKLYAPEALESFRELAQTGKVEFLAETNAHSLAALADSGEFRRQIEVHREKLGRYLGVRPVVFRGTELIYSDELGKQIYDMGYKGVLTEGAKHVLGWKSPNFLYCNARNPKLKVLLRNFHFSDDIAFRFSNKDWCEWPLTADKFATWLNDLESNQELANIFIDYETFGKRQPAGSGIFEFLEHLPGCILKNTPFAFKTPSQIIDEFQNVGAVKVPHPVSWADEERDLTAWLGNNLQESAFKKLYSFIPAIHECKQDDLLQDWEYLQSSDHFYYMSTKFFSDGVIQKHNNPYGNPYEAFMNYMNILSDFEMRLKACGTVQEEDENLSLYINLNQEQEQEIANLKNEVRDLKLRIKKMTKTRSSEGSGTKKEAATRSKGKGKSPAGASSKKKTAAKDPAPVKSTKTKK